MPTPRLPWPDDAERFAELARTGSPVLRAQLIADHLPMATRMARRFARTSAASDDAEDLVQVAALALVKAIDGFRPSLGFPFPAYAVPTILGELKRHRRDQGWMVRAPRRLQELHLQVQEAADELTQRLGRGPRPRELADYLGTTEEAILEAAEAAQGYRCISTDAPGPDDGEPLSASLGEDDRGLRSADDLVALAAGIRCLPARERRILALRFLHDRTQAEIAAAVGLSQMHVSRLLAQSLARLRASATDDGHRDRRRAVPGSRP